MRLLILLLAIVIGNARGEVCQVTDPNDYDINDVVLTFKNKCTSVETDQIHWNCKLSLACQALYCREELTIIGICICGCSSLTPVTFPEGLQQVGYRIL